MQILDDYWNYWKHELLWFINSFFVFKFGDKMNIDLWMKRVEKEFKGGEETWFRERCRRRFIIENTIMSRLGRAAILSGQN